MKNSGGEKKLSLFFFSLISKEMGGKGVRVEDGGGGRDRGNTASSKNSKFFKKKKSKQNKTHTHRK